MPASQQLLDDLAGAVLDGAAVEWEQAESSAGADARFVRHLRLVASVARVHRDALPDTTLTSSGPVLSHATPPERWGHLRLLERVGRGAFGEVFRAWDTRLERFDRPEIEALLPRIRAMLAPLETHARLFPAPPFLVDA